MGTATSATDIDIAGHESQLHDPHVYEDQQWHTTSQQTVEPLGIESTQETKPDYPEGSRFWFTIISICVILILGGLDANIVATTVPSITNDFHTVAYVGWYSSAFRLCSCAFQFGFAKMYTHFSIKSVLLASNMIFLVGSLLCATAASSRMFIAGRAVAGLGFAGDLAGSFAVLVHILPIDRRPVYAGLLACVESVAIIAAPIVGGALTQSLGWTWCFWYGYYSYAQLVSDKLTRGFM